MQTVSLVRESPISTSYRASVIKNSFDFQKDVSSFSLSVDVDLDFDWQVGLIIGSSGTGKSTIAKELFGEVVASYEYGGKSVVDDMPKPSTIEQITNAFSSVGFSSVPSWLKPYDVLSNGEKARVDLARMILEQKEVVVYDEFTSYLDRTVAQTCARSVEKVIRRDNKKFVGITCHTDVLSFMEPDWVIDTDTATMTRYPRGSLCRKQIDVVFRKGRDLERVWRVLGPYHYLAHTHKKGIPFVVAEIEGRIAGMFSWSRYPHPKAKNIMIGHRLVVHPDFQGLGLASKLLDFVGAILKKEKSRLRFVSSSMSVKAMLLRNKKWVIDRVGRVSSVGGSSSVGTKNSNGRISFSCEYLGA
jgi:ABC-type dipeptide/oligopeptide/nickel transport system ATPase subunit